MSTFTLDVVLVCCLIFKYTYVAGSLYNWNKRSSYRNKSLAWAAPVTPSITAFDVSTFGSFPQFVNTDISFACDVAVNFLLQSTRSEAGSPSVTVERCIIVKNWVFWRLCPTIPQKISSPLALGFPYHTVPCRNRPWCLLTFIQHLLPALQPKYTVEMYIYYFQYVLKQS